MTPRQGQLSLASDHGAPPTMVTAWWSSSTDRAGRSPRCELLTGSSIAVIQAGQSVDVGRLLAPGDDAVAAVCCCTVFGLVGAKRQRCSPRAAAWRWRPRQDGCDSPADACPSRTYHQSAPGSRLAESRVHPSPKCGPRTSSRPGVNCPFEAAVAGPVLRLAERKLERLVHEAGKPARQDAANVDAVEHGPAPVRPRPHARRRA